MGRRPCCSKDEGLSRGAWTAMEDKALTEYIRIHGEGKWRNLPKRAGLKRCGKSCRLRWLNYLRPDIKRGNITRDEEELIIRLHKLLGNRWSLIAGRLPGRTDNEIKNYWNTTIGKKVQLGHSFSDGNRKSPNQTQEKPTKSLQPPKLANTNSCTKVVRTKASRCTKVVIPHEPQKINVDHDQIGDNEDVVNAPILTNIDQVNDQFVGINDEPLSPIFLLNDENMSSCGFMVDFKMDENFLSDFLNVDFSQLFNNCNGGDKAAAGTCDEGHPRSPNAQALLFSEDKLHGPDFQPSMAPIVDSEIDWLIDNTAN